MTSNIEGLLDRIKMEEHVSYSTFEAFRPHFDALARVGYYKIVKKSTSPIRRAIQGGYRSFVWMLVLVYNLQHFIQITQVHSTDRIVDIVFTLLSTMNCLFKQIAFNVKSHRIDRILNVIDGPVFSPKNAYHVKVMKQNAMEMLRLLRFFSGSSFSCAMGFLITPLVSRAFGVEVHFSGYFPFDTSTSPWFEYASVHFGVILAFQAYGQTAMDCTIVAFYAQVKVQLQVLRYNLEHLVDLDDNSPEVLNMKIANGRSFVVMEDKSLQQIVHNRLVDCVRHHQLILWLSKEIDSLFTETTLFQFFVTAWVNCMTVYKIVGMSVFSTEFILMAIYLTCMSIQPFIYCFYGTQVKYESEFLNLSAYCGDWLSLPFGLRREMLIMMVSCSRPITPQTASVIPISLETFTTVLRASYTLFTILNRK